MYCEHCGSIINDSANFCEKCGFAVNQDFKADIQAQPEEKKAGEDSLLDSESKEINAESLSETRVYTKQPAKEAVSDETAMFNEISDAIKAAEDETPVISEEEIKEGVEKILSDEGIKNDGSSDFKDFPDVDEIISETVPDKTVVISSEKTAENRQAKEPVNTKTFSEDKETKDDATVFMKKSDIENKEASKKAAPKKETEPERVSGEVIDSGRNSGSSSKKAMGKRRVSSSYKIENAARGALGSVWVLLGTLALGVQIALMLVYSFSERIDEVLNFLGRLFFYQTNSMLYLRLCVAALAVIEIVMFIGFLLTYISANAKKKAFKTAGLSILQVLCAIGLIIICFLGLCAIGAALVAVRYIRHYYFISFEGISTGQIVYVCVMLSFLIIIYILVVVFFSKLISSIARAKRAAAKGSAKKNIASFNVFMLFLIAVFIVAFTIACLLTSAPSSWMIVTALLCLAASCVFYALFMIKYRKRMKAVL